LKAKNIIPLIFFSLLLSSCGLIEKFQSSDSTTESTTENKTEAKAESTGPSDDLFGSSEANKETVAASTTTGTDAPSNIEKVQQQSNDDLASLSNEFSGEKPVAETKPIKVEEHTPIINSDATDSKVVTSSMSGDVKEYKVQKGETLMQIAFKLYGDIGKWKDLKSLNNGKFAKNSALRANMTLKYHAPETPFVWNPEGTPYLIKNGDTLGTISASVYNSKKKWKTIWENNKPLIKNPNVIYAGFTLFYKNTTLGNYVQPKEVQTKVVTTNPKMDANAVEDIKVENALTEIERLDSPSEEIRDIQSSTIRKPATTTVRMDDASSEEVPVPMPDTENAEPSVE
jgi:nucleoid-associated protein YgaU